MISDFFPLIFAGVTLLALIEMMLLVHFSVKEHSIEEDRNPILTLKCGVTLDIVTLSMPFVRVSCYEDFLVISYWKQHVINYKDIKDISIKKILTWYEGKLIVSNDEFANSGVYIRCTGAKELYKFLNGKTGQLMVGKQK